MKSLTDASVEFSPDLMEQILIKNQHKEPGMGREALLRNYVLNDLRARLISEHIPPGSRLPSIQQMRDLYGVGRSTVRAILQQLSEEGLVELAERRTASAAHFTHDDEWNDFWKSHVLRDRYNILSGYFSMVQVLPPIIAFALQRSEALQNQLRVPLRSLEHVSDVTRLIESVLLGSGSLCARLMPLFLQHSAAPYFWETSGDFRGAARHLLNALASDPFDYAAISQSLHSVASEARSIVRSLADSAGNLPSPNPADRTWVLFPQTESRYQQIALDLLVRIGIGGWGPVGLLPSEQRLAAHYGVSVSTVREALSRLDESGFTHTVNGRGTFASEQRDARGFTPWLENTIIRALQAAQLIALMMPVCARDAAKRCTSEDITRLEESVMRKPVALPIRTLFHFVIRRQVLSPVRLILARAGMACDWGISVALAPDRSATRAILDAKAHVLLDFLRKRKATEFAAEMSQLYQTFIRLTRDTMVGRYSISSADAVDVPPVIMP